MQLVPFFLLAVHPRQIFRSTIDFSAALAYTSVGNCTAVRFGRMDRGPFTCRRGKVSAFAQIHPKIFTVQAAQVDILPTVCYIAREATLKQFDRHLEAYCPKQQSGSFFRLHTAQIRFR